jgi:LacI family transcriptional regulator
MTVTIYDIAKAVGTSYATVSRALSNNPNVKDATRGKILEIAQQMGYRRDFAATALKKGKSCSVGVIVSEIVNPFCTEQIRLIEEECRRRDYRTVLMDFGNNEDRQRQALEQMLSYRCDGVITSLLRYKPMEDLFQEYARRKIPCVVLGPPLDMVSDPGDYLDLIDINTSRGLEMVVEHLVSLGHRDIVCTIACPQSREEWAKGFELFGKTLKKHGLPFSPKNIYRSSPDNLLESGYDAAGHILSYYPEVTAIVGYNDIYTMGLLQAFTERGLRVPEDISLVSSDNTWLGRSLPIPLTTIDPQIRRVSAMAINLLFERFEGNRQKAKSVTIEVDFVVRKSTTPCKKIVRNSH